MPVYKANGKTYNIPDDKIEAFEKRYPNAEVEIYDNDGAAYSLPISKRVNFQKKFDKWSYTKPKISESQAVANEPPASKERKRQIPGVDFSTMPEEYRTPHANQEPGAAASTAPEVETSEPTEFEKPDTTKSASSSVIGTSSTRRIQRPGHEVSPMPEEYRTQLDAKDPLAEGFEDEPQGPNWEQRQQAGNKKQVKELSGHIDSLLTDAVNASVDRYNKQQEDAEKESWFKRLLRGIGENYAPHGDAMIPAMRENNKMYRGAGDPELQNKIASLQAAKTAMTNAQNIIDEADRAINKGDYSKFSKSFFGGVLRGFGDKFFDVSTWDMGMSDLENATAMMQALDAYDKGTLTEAQQALLDAKAVELATNAYFGSYIGKSYQYGGVGAESIPFMLEMCINPASSVGEAATSRMARYAIKRFGKEAAKKASHKVARAAGRAGADLLGAAAMTATTGAIGTTADAIERMNGQVMVDELEPGVSAFAGAFEDSQEAPAEAFAKAFAGRTIENYSEMFGEYFSPFFKKAGKRIKTKANQIGLEKVTRFIDDVSATELGQLVSDFEKHTKWHGSFGEYAEEVVGNSMNALVVGDMTFDTAEGTGVFNLEQNIDTFLSVALMGGFISAVKTAGYRTPKYRTRKLLERADNAAGAAFDGTGMWEDMRRLIQEDPNVALHNVLTEDYTSEQKDAVLQYVKALQEYNGVLKAEQKRRTAPDSNPVQTDLETSFDNGYELVGEEEMADARNMYNAQKARMQEALYLDDIDDAKALHPDDLPYSDEEKQIIIDYLNSKATYQGMIQRVRDDIDSRIMAAETEIDINTNATDGYIHSAVTSDDRNVYITDGRIVLSDDGTIDREKSDKEIIIRDMQTGKKEFWDISMLKHVDSAIDPVEEKNAAAEAVRESVGRTAADKIDGRLHFQMGDVYTLTTPNGDSFPIEITANEQGIIDNGDGTVNVILNGATVDGSPVISQMSKSEIQQMANATNLSRLAQYQQQKDAERANIPPYRLDDVLTLNVDGQSVRGSITANADADGRYEVYTETPVAGHSVNLFTKEELDGMVSELNGQPVSSVTQNNSPGTEKSTFGTENTEIGTENTENSTPPTENNTVPAENGTPAPATDTGNAMSRIPVDENNVPQFEQAPLNDGWDALMELNEGNEQDTIEMARDMIANSEAELQKAQNKKPKGTNPLEIKRSRDEIRAAVSAAQKKVDFWKRIAGYPEMRRREMEEQAKMQRRLNLAEARRIQRQQGRFGKEDRVLGDALSFEEYVMRSVANGAVRFKWSNNPNNSSIKGLGSHLGFMDNPSERNHRIWMLSNEDGMYPEAAAEELLRGYAEQLGLDEVPGMDTMDAFGTMLDVLLSYSSSRSMFDAAKELHQKNDPTFLEAKEAEMAQAMAEDEAAQSLESKLSNETNEFGKPFILSSDGTTTFGEITADSGLVPAPIKLSEGEDTVDEEGRHHGYGLKHIEAGHGQQIRDAGYPSVEAFVETVAANYDTIREGNMVAGNQTYLLELTDEHNNTVFVQLSRDGSYWNVNSAGIFKTKYSKNKKKVESVPAVGTSTNADADGVNHGQTEGATVTSGNSPATSESKGSEISGENNLPAENPTVVAIQAAREEVNTEPTDAQKEAGNYKKGHVKIDGFDISIENPKGSVRRGTSPDGIQWETEMNNDYGYIRSTEGVDGDHIDVYLSDNPSEGNVYVIDQIDPNTGEFDEHKVMYGFPDEESARASYLSNYEDGWQGLGTITGVSKDEFKKWVDSSHRKTKPFTEYKSVKPVEAQSGPKQVNVESLMGALSTTGQAKLSDFAEDIVPSSEETEPDSVTIEPATYTTKAGKTLNMFRVNPGRELSKDEWRAVSKFLKDNRGWKDRENGGFMVRSEENANALANMLRDADAMSEARPVSLTDIQQLDSVSVTNSDDVTSTSEDSLPEWGYELVTYSDGHSYLSRYKRMPNGIPVYDGRHIAEANDPETLKAILQNNNLYDLLSETDKSNLDYRIELWQFKNRVKTEGINGLKLNDKVIYKGKEATVHDFEDYGDHRPVLDVGLSPVMYEVAEWDKVQKIENSDVPAKDAAPKAEERPINPSGNKLVTDERYAELRMKMMQKIKGQMNSGIDPEILAIGTEMAVYHIEKGARKFVEFAKAMIADLSDAIRPYLKAFYNGARDLPEMQESGLAAEMDSYADVQAVDVANFDKETANIISTVEMIEKEAEVEQQAKVGAEKLHRARNIADKTSHDTYNDTANEEDITEQVNEPKEKTKNTVKSSKNKKKSLSSQGESIGSLFSDVEEETGNEITNTNNNELSTGSTSKDGEVGERKQQEVERPSGTGVVENNHGDSAADQGRSTGLAERAPKQPTVKKNKTNNHVERGESYAPTTPAQRFSANVAAIRKMRELMDADRKATPEDMEILRKFTGWGGIGTYFNNEYSAENRELKSLLGDEEYQAAVMSANSAYYTPVNVIDAMWDAAKNLGFTGGTVLEGSAGIGNILASMPKKMSEASDITAVEIDSVTGNILKLLYPEADVNIKGFEETDIPNNSVDLAITNVPFVTGLHVYDKVEKDLSRKFGDIHDFCIAKNVRKLKEGGIGIFITSKGTLDKSKALRNWVVNEGDADFIGAFRLNNTTFIGTSVTSDIIIIRKRVNGKVSPNAIDVSGTTVTRRDTYSPMRYGEKDQPVAMEYNSYFVEHPEFMAGEMKFAFEKGETFRPTSSSLYPKEGTDQDKALAKWVKTLRNDAEKAQATQEQSNATEQESTDNVKEGQLIVNSKGEICLSQRGKAVPIGVNSNKVKGQPKATVVKDYDAIKDALKEVLDYQVANESDEGLKPLLKKLNDAYDSFVKKYGQLNKNVAISFLRNDVDFATIAAIEDFNETETIDGSRKIETKKTDVFSRRMVGYRSEPTPKTSKEGVIVSMNKFGHIDLEYIASKIGIPVEDVRKEIIESKLGYEDPQSGRIEVSYEYLSGNVREKLEYAKSQNNDGRYDSNIKALEKVIPYDIPAHLIEFSLGSDWLDKQLYIDFAREKYGLTDEFKIANIGGVWQVVGGYVGFGQNNEKNRSAGVTSETVGKTAYGHELMICAMNNTPYTFSKTVKDRYTGETTTITDKNASQVATGRMSEIKEEFRDWCRDKMMNDTSLAEKVQKVYNDLFNAIVPKGVGEEFLPEHFEGSNIAINLYPHQKKAVIRGTTEPLMLAHEVGSGKTFTLISTAMEMRRLGTAKKPMIVAQNATVGQFVSEAKKLYPNAKVLSLTEKDRSQEGRLAFYAKIKYNDWDLIIIPQSTFDLIPDSEERQQMFVQEKIDEKMYVLDQARAANADSNAIRRLEKELKDLETEYNTGVIVKSGKKDAKKEAEAKSNAAAKAKKQLDRKIDDVANFDDMGIDALLIDEAHEYKHLGFSTSIKRGVKGIDPSYSKKSAGVYLKTRAVFDKSGWKNVVFATGTPISNTAAEIWTFMKYLMPDDIMKQNHIYYFDDFVRNFGKIAQSLEFATNGKFKENTRFGAYVNVPELVRIWSSVCDTVLTKDAEAASGTKLTDKLPAMEDGKAKDIFLPQSPSLIGIMRALKKTLEEYEKLSGKEKKEQSHIPLTMYGIAKRAAIDPRLVDADAVDEPLSKTNRAVEEILKDLETTKEYKGTCAVFCDNYRRLEYDETGKKKEAFNLFQEIKRKLVEAGVPENQIVVMESGMSIEKKEKIFDQVNEGSIRVILGSTRTLGTGVNIQQRLHLLIHMDAPDRPMDYTQRNGRILRQGNLHKEWGKTVKVLRFGVEDSLDVTSYQRLKTKSSFIDSIMDGKPLLANGMEGRVLEEEEEGLFDNPVAVLSGSQFALKKSQAERELRKYQGKLKQYQQDQIYIERQLKDNKNRIANNERFIKDYEASIALAKESFKDGKVKVVTVVGVPCRTEEEINTAIREKITKPLNAIKERARNSWGWNTTDYEYPLSFDGITVKVKVSVGRKEGMYVNGQMQKPSSFTVYSYSCTKLLNNIERSISSTEGVKGIIDEFRTNLATGIYQQDAVNRLSANIERMTSDNELMLQRRGVPFADQGKLDEAKARVDEYTKLMKNEMAEKEKKYADAQAVETKVDLSTIDDEDSEEDTNRYRDANIFSPEEITDMETPVLQSKGTFKSLKDAEEWAKANLQGKSFKNRFTGEEIAVTGRSISEMLNPNTTKRINEHTHMAALMSVPDFIITGIPAEIHADTHGRYYDVLRLFNAIDIDGKTYRVKSTVKRTNEGDKYYTYEIQEMELIEDTQISALGLDSNTVLNSTNSITGAKLLKGVKKTNSDELIIPGNTTNTRNDESDDIRESISELAGRLGENVRIVENVNELTDSDPKKQRRMRNSFGWFNRETGEIVVVLPNARSVADARATVFHEAVAHKGLLELVGKDRFNEFLERIYAGATPKVREAINDLAKNHGWNLAEGIEEYIARLAESGFDERENRTLWQKIRDFFEDMMNEAKLRLGFRITDNTLRYALWRSYQMKRSKGVVAVAEDIEMQQNLGLGRFNDLERRFRDSDEVIHDHAIARDAYEKATASGLYQFREAVQDSMHGLQTLMQDILKAEGKGKVYIEDVDAFENAYIAENAMSSMNMDEKAAFNKLVMEPLLKAVSAFGVPQKEVTDYMMAKHGLERNKFMAERAAKEAEKADEEHERTYDEWYEHFRKKDYAGLTGLTDKKTVLDAENEAMRIVNEFEGQHDTAELWQKTKAATKASLQKLRESGLLTKEGFDNISGMYEYYIPLRGWDETTSDEVYGYLTDRKSIMNSPIKKADRRSSKADDPLSYIASMAETAIMQGNRNRMKQRFLNFVLNHPSDLVSVNDIWLQFDDVKGEWHTYFADLNPTDTADEVEQKIADFEETMKALAKSDPDHYKSGKDAINIPFKVVNNNLKEHQVLVKRGGRTYVLTINGNPRAAQALNGLSNPDTEIKGVAGAIREGSEKVNRFLSFVYTGADLGFALGNFLRDMLYSNCMTWVKESPSYALKFHKNFGKMNPAHMMYLFIKWENGTLNESNNTEKMFKQFLLSGGKTGYTTMMDIKRKKKEIATQIKKYGKTMPISKAWDFLGTSFDIFNKSVENTARFAAFVTSREMGRTVERSVYDAKEVSVNFNKKGDGDRFLKAEGQTTLGNVGSFIGALGRHLYVFWGPGVQGFTNFGRAVKRHPTKAIAVMATLFTLGLTIAALSAYGGGDDDDENYYFNLPEYVRRSNICFRAGDSWITIPLPVEFRGIYGMGELAMGVLSGKERYSDSELAFQISSQVSQVLPLDMLEGGGGISPLIPSAAKPLVEAYVMNKSWTGLPIYKDTYFNENMPEWTKAYKSANRQLVGLAEAANRFSGGDEYTKGDIDINPARIEYMLNGYFGGYSKTVNSLVKAAETMSGKRDFEWRNMLVASRVVKSGDERTHRRKLTNEYYNIQDEAEKTAQRLKGYEEKADAGVAEYAEKLDFLNNSPEYLRYLIYDEYKADLQYISEEMKHEVNTQKFKDLEDEYYEIIAELVGWIHKAQSLGEDASKEQMNALLNEMYRQNSAPQIQNSNR